MYGINLGYFNCIGNGSSRKVFDLGNGYVIKNATNLAGIEQNYEEYNISVFDNTGIFANVIEAYDKYKIIVMEKAKRVKNIKFIYKCYNVKNRIEFMCLPEINSLCEKYDLVINDLCKDSSWGIIKGRLVIIDYGFTKRVREKYYQS